jgi:hypothetical protein
MPQAKKRIGALRRRVYAVLEQGDGAGGVSLALNRFPIVLIVATLTATVIETVPDMAPPKLFEVIIINRSPTSWEREVRNRNGGPIMQVWEKTPTAAKYRGERALSSFWPPAGGSYDPSRAA